MEIKYGYNQAADLAKNYIKGGVHLKQEEGIFLVYETDPELVKAALPPVLDYVDNIVTIYVMRIGDPNLGPAFMECALILNATYQGKRGAYQPSFLMYGPGAEAATVMGREIYGISKKYADDVRVTRCGNQVNAYIRRGGKVILDAECELGSYNDPVAATPIMGAAKAGDSHGGHSFFFTYDCHQKDDGDMEFTGVHINDALAMTTHTKDWEPGTILRLNMEASINDPWSYFTVNKLLGCGYTHEELKMVSQTHYHNVGDPEANIAKLIPGKFDLAAFGLEYHQLNAAFN